MALDNRIDQLQREIRVRAAGVPVEIDRLHALVACPAIPFVPRLMRNRFSAAVGQAANGRSLGLPGVPADNPRPEPTGCNVGQLPARA
jgi:hypothetical protein